ncbi:hypothetical protein ACWPKO_29375 (plasmid) [Coraliomargarita sp. W4R53]
MRLALGARVAFSVGMGLFAVAMLAAPAEAHPDGPPQTLLVSASDATVTLHWASATDDLSALGYSLGLTQTVKTFVYDENGELLVDESDEDDLTVLGADASFSDYLLSSLQVTTDEGPCIGRVGDTTHLATAGVSIRFDCPAPVTEAEIGATLLQDIDSRYQLLATSDIGERFTYTNTDSVKSWSLSPAQVPAGDENAPWWPMAGIITLWLAGMAVIFFTRKSHRHITPG